MRKERGLEAKTVSPNPFTDRTTFYLKSAGAYCIRIFDITGRLIDQTSFTGTEYTYNSNDLTTGVYFYEISLDAEGLSSANLTFSRGVLIKR